MDSTEGSLIDVDASADLSSGSVDAGVSLDTENTDKILEADLAAGAGETGDITGSTDIVAGDITTNSGAGAESDLGGSSAADSIEGSLIDVDASADLSSGSVDASVSLDTDNTDKILEADLTAGSDETGGITGSTDITAGDITADSVLPAEITESAISSETDIGAEVDTSGGTIGGEADIGIEADVEGGTEGNDVADDPADGLSAPGL